MDEGWGTTVHDVFPGSVCGAGVSGLAFSAAAAACAARAASRCFFDTGSRASPSASSASCRGVRCTMVSRGSEPGETSMRDISSWSSSKAFRRRSPRPCSTVMASAAARASSRSASSLGGRRGGRAMAARSSLSAPIACSCAMMRRCVSPPGPPASMASSSSSMRWLVSAMRASIAARRWESDWAARPSWATQLGCEITQSWSCCAARVSSSPAGIPRPLSQLSTLFRRSTHR